MINISISTNFLVIISFLILFIIIGLIIYIIYNDKKLDQEEIDDLIEDIVNAKPRDQKENVKVTQVTPDVSEQLNLEQMLNEMQSSLDRKQEKTIETYEKEQDENAIISIRELKKSAINNIDNYIDDYEAEQERESIISYKELNSIDNLTEKEELIKTPVRKAIAKIETNDNHKKFHSTDFISPIYGKMDNHIEYPKVKAYNKEADLDLNEYFGRDIGNHQLEQTLNVEPLSEEMKRNTEFLKALKEFRNNL